MEDLIHYKKMSKIRQNFLVYEDVSTEESTVMDVE